MAPPSYKTNNNDDEGDKHPPSPTLKSKLGDLSEEDLVALLKSMNIEVKIKTEDKTKHMSMTVSGLSQQTPLRIDGLTSTSLPLLQPPSFNVASSCVLPPIWGTG
jgi:hypothetical protein